MVVQVTMEKAQKYNKIMYCYTKRPRGFRIIKSLVNILNKLTLSQTKLSNYKHSFDLFTDVYDYLDWDNLRELRHC